LCNSRRQRGTKAVAGLGLGLVNLAL